MLTLLKVIRILIFQSLHGLLKLDKNDFYLFFIKFERQITWKHIIIPNHSYQNRIGLAVRPENKPLFGWFNQKNDLYDGPG